MAIELPVEHYTQERKPEIEPDKDRHVIHEKNNDVKGVRRPRSLNKSISEDMRTAPIEAVHWSDYDILSVLRKGANFDTFTAIRVSRNDEDDSEDSSTLSFHDRKQPRKGANSRIQVSLKCVKKKSSSAEMDDQSKILISEAEHLIQCARHSCIVQLHAVSWLDGVTNKTNSGRMFSVVDVVEETLFDRLKLYRSKGNDLEGRMKMVAVKLAGAMKFVHSKGVVLGNLSPYTVGFDSKGGLKIMDFSMALNVAIPKAKEERSAIQARIGRTRAQMNVDATRYWSPEVLQKKEHEWGEFSSDVYSFAIILWELITLKKPYPFIDPSKMNATSKTQTAKAVSILSQKVGERKVRPRLPRRKINRQTRTLLRQAWEQNPLERTNFIRVWLALSDTYGGL